METPVRFITHHLNLGIGKTTYFCMLTHLYRDQKSDLVNPDSPLKPLPKVVFIQGLKDTHAQHFLQVLKPFKNYTVIIDDYHKLTGDQIQANIRVLLKQNIKFILLTSQHPGKKFQGIISISLSYIYLSFSSF